MSHKIGLIRFAPTVVTFKSRLKTCLAMHLLNEHSATVRTTVLTVFVFFLF